MHSHPWDPRIPYFPPTWLNYLRHSTVQPLFGDMQATTKSLLLVLSLINQHLNEIIDTIGHSGLSRIDTLVV